MDEDTGFLSQATGSFSTPAIGNPTIAMMRAAFDQLGVDVDYLNFDVRADGLEAAVAGARATGWLGFNLSTPHKVSVIPLLDGVVGAAAICQAVNCVVREGDALVGHNTDGAGFIEALTGASPQVPGHVLLIGAGGAARAIAVGLAELGVARISLANRGVERSDGLAALMRTNTSTEITQVGWDAESIPVPEDLDLVVNATSIGLFPSVDEGIPIDLSRLDAGTTVADVIPNPAVTRLIAGARDRGLPTLDGRGMVVNQAAIAVELWTGRTPDKAVMRAAVDRALG